MKANFLLKLIAKDKGIKEFEISSWDCDIKELKDDNSNDVIELQKDLSYGHLDVTLLINGKEIANGNDHKKMYGALEDLGNNYEELKRKGDEYDTKTI